MSFKSYEYGLSPHDGFKVYRHFFFNHQQLEILNRLYIPLIGFKAIGVYHFMNQFIDEVEDTTLTHYTIMNELKINLLEFREYMDLLEGIGLIKTFVKHDSNQSLFIYELIQPPTAYQFFNDPMLSIYLYNEVDNRRYKDLKAYFEKNEPDLNAFQQVTRKFTDVFKVPHKNISIDASTIQKENHSATIDLDNESFDFDMLRDMLQHHFISGEIITKEAKQLILQLATLYGLTPTSMKRIILNSITQNQTLSFEEMRKQARSHYLIEHQQQLPKLQTKANPSNYLEQSQRPNETTDDIKESDSWFKLLEDTSPIDMLASWSESEPTLQQKRMVEELIEREKLSFGVINILLQFVMLKNEMKLPKSYIFEIASNWKKLGIKTAQQAYDYALKTNQQINDSITKKTKRQYKQRDVASIEKTPKWLKDKNQQDEKPNNNDAQFEKDREAFRAQLEQDWED